MAARAREAARALAPLGRADKDRALAAVAAAIEERRDELVAANRLDLAAAAGERPAILDRLTLDDARTDALAAAVLDVAALPDPAGAVLRSQTLENGLRLTKLRVPLGVVLIVYEARPNVTVDAAMLCLKSGNACILRGSRLAEHTNRALVDLMREALSAAGLPADAVQVLGTDRAELNSLLADPDRGRRGHPPRRRGAEEVPARDVADPGAGCGRRQLPRLRRRRGRPGQGDRHHGQRQGAAAGRVQRRRDGAGAPRPGASWSAR